MMESSGQSIARNRRLFVGRQADAHGSPPAGLAFGGNVAAVRLDQMPGNWQTKTSAAGVAGLVETIENLG